jgi:PTS system fructose-specific IIC component
LRQWLMTGVSYMIPFVAAGGILIALSFLISGDPAGFTSLNYQNGLDGVDANGVALAMNVRIGAILFSLAMGPWNFLLPALAGYIAFGMADRPGLVPGFAAGYFAGSVGAGFLGALLGGLIAGAVAQAISNWNVPNAVRPLMPLVINPLLSTVVVGLAMVTVGKAVVTPLNEGANTFLTNQAGSGAIVLGIIIGLMMAFDMGGPINKVAYTFGVASLTAANGGGTVAMACVMAAGMTPPLGLFLATVLRKSLFNDAEQEQGKAALVLGLTFITEGAIPFAAADPARVIPSIMAGSAVAGAIVGAAGATLSAPHGGIAVLPLIGNPAVFLLALVAGAVVTALLVIALKGANKAAA